MTNSFFVQTTAMFLGAIVSTISPAATTTYVNRVAWANATTSVQTENYESYGWGANGTFFGFGVPTTIGGITYAADHRLYGIGASNPDDAPYISSAYLTWQIEAFSDARNEILITLPRLVTAVAFDFGQFYGSVASFSVQLGNSDSFSLVTANNSYSFFGATSNVPFASLRLSAPVIEGPYPLIDNLSFGVSQAIPEPPAVLLLGLGLAWVGSRRRCSPKLITCYNRK